MGTLYFLDPCGKRRIVQKHIKKDDVCYAIHKYVHELNPDFKIYYIRSWGFPNEMTYDFGSHTEFFKYMESDI